MPITLRKLIEDLREEMLAAHQEALDKNSALFVLDEAEITVAVEIGAEVHGKLSFVLHEVGAKLSGNEATTIKIKLKEYFPEQHGQDQGRLLFQHLRNTVAGNEATVGQSIDEGRATPPMGTGRPVK